MGGFFLDSIIRSIVRNVRKQRRVDNALSWPIAVGKISMSRFGENTDGHASPDLVFSYEVNGEMFYGSAGGAAVETKQIKRVTDAINAIRVIHVRYDSSNPTSSCLLNQDNPDIPFELDHTPY